MRSTFFLFVTLAFSFSGYAAAQETDFFWSDRDLNTGAVNQPLVVGSKSVGDTGSLFLYYSASGPSQSDIDVGAVVDVATSQPGIIRFTNAETFDFPGIFDTGRWSMSFACSDTFGQSESVTDDFVNELGAFTLTGVGIGANNKLLDPGYDQDADAFLFGRVDYEVIGEGCVQIHIGRGKLGIANLISAPFLVGSNNTLYDPSFGSALVSSIGSFNLGDVDLGGDVNFSDIGPFIEILQSDEFSEEADINCDGVVNFSDIPPFISLLMGTGLEVIDPSVESTVPQFGMLGDSTNDGFIDLLDVVCFS